MRIIHGCMKLQISNVLAIAAVEDVGRSSAPFVLSHCPR